jgi:putative SOS response-associated peptidase YedK
VIRRHPETGEHRLDRLWWGLIPHWVHDEKGGRKPINAKAETISSLPSFREAYAKRRCIVPIDNFFEWRRAGPGPKQPYAVAMKDGSLVPYPAEPMTMWPVSTRVNSPANDNPEVLTPVV